MRKLHVAMVSVLLGGGGLVGQGLSTAVSAASPGGATPVVAASHGHEEDSDHHHCGCHGRHHEQRDEHHDEHSDGDHYGQRESQDRLIVIEIEHLLS
jgi:hypothetical protein